MSKTDINCHCGTGRLGKMPELRQTANGKSVTDLAVAMTVGYGERQSTVWTKLTVWGKSAEFLCEYANVGDLIAWQNAEYRTDEFMGKEDKMVKVHYFECSMGSQINLISQKSTNNEGDAGNSEREYPTTDGQEPPDELPITSNGNGFSL